MIVVEGDRPEQKRHTRKKKEKRKEEIVNFLVLIKFVCGLEATVFVRFASTLWCLGRFCSKFKSHRACRFMSRFSFRYYILTMNGWCVFYHLNILTHGVLWRR